MYFIIQLELSNCSKDLFLATQMGSISLENISMVNISTEISAADISATEMSAADISYTEISATDMSTTEMSTTDMSTADHFIWHYCAKLWNFHAKISLKLHRNWQFFQNVLKLTSKYWNLCYSSGFFINLKFVNHDPKVGTYMLKFELLGLNHVDKTSSNW